MDKLSSADKLDKALDSFPKGYTCRERASLFALWATVVFFCVFALLGLAHVNSYITHPLLLIGVYVFIAVALLIAFAVVIHETLAKRRYGDPLLVLDPNPGQLGGSVAGHTDVDIQYEDATQAVATLSCVHVYVRKTGGRVGKPNKKRTVHDVLWQAHTKCKPEHKAKATRLNFAFNTPPDLKETENNLFRGSIEWRVSFQTVVKGVDFDREYPIPVLEVPAHIRVQARVDTDDELPALSADTLPAITQEGQSTSFVYPNIKMNMGTTAALLFAIVFLVLGYLGIAAQRGGPVGMEIIVQYIFLGVGVLLVARLLQAFIVSRETIVTDETVKFITRVFGIPMSKELPSSVLPSMQIRRADEFMTLRGKLLTYDIVCFDERRMAHICGENILGSRAADTVKSKILQAAGLDTV